MTDNPINEYIRQLQETFRSKLYYFTLIGSMTLIDTCAALNSENGETTSQRFKDWFDKYLKDYTPSKHYLGETTGFSSDECYKFRCRLLHQSRAGIDIRTSNKKVKTGKVIFHVEGWKIHCSNSKGDYFLDIEYFMNDVIAAVKSWLIDIKDNEVVQGNLSKIIQMRKETPDLPGIMGGSNGISIY